MTIERSARRLTFIAGAGFVSFVAGAFATALLTLQWREALSELTSSTTLLLLTAALQSIWVLVFLPMSGWLAGRYLHLNAARFAVPAALTGLFFELGLVTAHVGSDTVFLDWPEAVTRLIYFISGIALTIAAFKRAAHAEAAAQERAKTLAGRSAQAYLAFVEANRQPPEETR